MELQQSRTLFDQNSMDGSVRVRVQRGKSVAPMSSCITNICKVKKSITNKNIVNRNLMQINAATARQTSFAHTTCRYRYGFLCGPMMQSIPIFHGMHFHCLRYAFDASVPLSPSFAIPRAISLGPFSSSSTCSAACSLI